MLLFIQFFTIVVPMNARRLCDGCCLVVGVYVCTITFKIFH